MAIDPTQTAQCFRESWNSLLIFGVVFRRLGEEHSDAAKPSGLLRARGPWEGRHHTEDCNKLSPSHDRRSKADGVYLKRINLTLGRADVRSGSRLCENGRQ